MRVFTRFRLRHKAEKEEEEEKKMATRVRVGSGKAMDMKKLGETVEKPGGAMERFGGATMALLPWTRQMIAVLWDQLRLLLHVIYYTFISVFQMFRFEVHVRITDDPSGATDPGEPFLFSDPSEPFLFPDPTEALLSTLRGEDGEGAIYIGHKRPAGWASVGDWNFFVSSSEARCSSDEERSAASCWSSEEEHLEFDCDESKALWESLSRSGDPYDPFCFTACITTHSKAFWGTEATPTDTNRGRAKSQSCTGAQKVESEEESKESWETESRASPSPCEKRESDESEASWDSESPSADSPALDREDSVLVGRFWESSSAESSEAEDSPHAGALVKRSDSEVSWSSDNSENSENLEENQLLWDMFTKQEDPYNPLCFSVTCRAQEEALWSRAQEEALWSDLSKEHDPYHPLNFSALEPREERHTERESAKSQRKRTGRRRGEKPKLTPRRVQRHSHPQVQLRPWIKASEPVPDPPAPTPDPPGPPHTPVRHLRFSDQVHVHVMRSWEFALRQSRRGHWEELARDRDRFRRRIQDSETTLGPILSPEHRERVLKRIQTSTEQGLNQD